MRAGTPADRLWAYGQVGLDGDALLDQRGHAAVLRGHRDARTIAGPETLAEVLAERAAEGDYVVCLGAGNITQWAAALPAELGALIGKHPE